MIGVALAPADGEGIQHSIDLLRLALEDQPVAQTTQRRQDIQIGEVEEIHIGLARGGPIGVAEPSGRRFIPDHLVLAVKELSDLFLDGVRGLVRRGLAGTIRGALAGRRRRGSRGEHLLGVGRRVGLGDLRHRTPRGRTLTGTHHRGGQRAGVVVSVPIRDRVTRGFGGDRLPRPREQAMTPFGTVDRRDTLLGEALHHGGEGRPREVLGRQSGVRHRGQVAAGGRIPFFVLLGDGDGVDIAGSIVIPAAVPRQERGVVDPVRRGNRVETISGPRVGGAQHTFALRLRDQTPRLLALQIFGARPPRFRRVGATAFPEVRVHHLPQTARGAPVELRGVHRGSRTGVLRKHNGGRGALDDRLLAATEEGGLLVHHLRGTLARGTGARGAGLRRLPPRLRLGTRRTGCLRVAPRRERGLGRRVHRRARGGSLG